MDYLIGIDVGTSAVKVVLFEEKGRAVASAARKYPLYQPENGWAEQNPEDWKNGVLEALREVVKVSRVEKERIKGVGISGQMHGLVMLDQAGEVIRPSIIWCDQRTAKEVEDMKRLMPVEDWIRITANPPLTGWTAAKILWVRKHEPENYKRCRHILLPKDYIRYILTGDFATEVSDASGMQLLDVPGRCWSKEVLNRLSIEESLLGRVYESCEVTGRLLPAIGKITGLSPETKVVGGAGDNAAAAVGTGIVMDGRAFTTIGTSGVVFAHSSRLAVDPKGRVHTCCSAVPGEWHVMGVTQAAGLSFQWFRDNFCQKEKLEAEQSGLDVYDLMSQKAAACPPGSNKLFYLPYLMGERTPHLDPYCRGVFFGLSAIHTKEHMLRAVMEGVTYSLKDCISILEEMGIQVEEMMACGGGGKSPVWRQMLADMYHCRVKTVEQAEGPALGAAILAGVGTGLYENVPSACELLVREADCHEPNEEQWGFYCEGHEIYKELYEDLKGTFKKLSKLSGLEQKIINS